MKPLVSVCIGLVLASLPAAAIAQVTQTYQYDANGRLTGVTTTGSGGTNTAAYAYDDADNRTSRSQTGTTAYAAISRLDVGDRLLPHQALVSADGRFSFALQPSGGLELRLGDATLWSHLRSSETEGLFSVDADGIAQFLSSAFSRNTDGAYFAVQNNGNLVLSDRTGSTVLWQTNICCH